MQSNKIYVREVTLKDIDERNFIDILNFLDRDTQKNFERLSKVIYFLVS